MNNRAINQVGAESALDMNYARVSCSYVVVVLGETYILGDLGEQKLEDESKPS